jgi:hypothetical protein
LIFLVHEASLDRAVAKREQTTPGVVTAHEPANHNRYSYGFSVGGNAYTGWQIPRNDELQVGKRVIVYYDPSDPNINALTDFDELSTNVLGPAPILVLGIGAMAFFIFRQRRRKVPTI